MKEASMSGKQRGNTGSDDSIGSSYARKMDKHRTNWKLINEHLGPTSHFLTGTERIGRTTRRFFY